jgi:hypothetical protein
LEGEIFLSDKLIFIVGKLWCFLSIPILRNRAEIIAGRSGRDIYGRMGE